MKKDLKYVDEEVVVTQTVLHYEAKEREINMVTLPELLIRLDEQKGKVTIYIVMALGKSSSMEELTLIGAPFRSKYLRSLFINTRKKCSRQDRGYFEHDRSLVDMNIVPNAYNNHLAFFTEAEAEEYLKFCINGNIDLH